MNEIDINRIINDPEILIIIIFVILIFLIGLNRKKNKYVPKKNENLKKNYDITVLTEYEEKLLALKDLYNQELIDAILYEKKVDIIFIDSLHEPEHIEKLIYFYYKKIKIGGKILIDDVSWLQHVQKAPLDNEFTEIINRLTFKKILEIYFTNQDNFNLKIDFSDCGLAIITKIQDKLNVSKKIKDRSFSFKNILKKFYRPKPVPNSFKRFQT